MKINLHEDTINQIEFLPEENMFFLQKNIDILQQSAQNITINEIEKPKVPIIKNRISIFEINKLLSKRCVLESSEVYSGFGAKVYKLINTKAFIFERIGFFIKYNDKNEVTNFFISTTSIAPAPKPNSVLPEIIQSIGDKFRLIIVDWDEELIINLKSKNQIQNYLINCFGFSFL